MKPGSTSFRLSAIAICVQACASCSALVDKPIAKVQTSPVVEALVSPPSAALSKPDLQAIVVGEEPSRTVEFGGTTLELWEESAQHVPFLVVSRQGKEILKRDFATGSRIDFLCLERSRVNQEQDPLLKLDHRGQYVIVKCETRDAEYQYFVLRAIEGFKLSNTICSGKNPVRLIESRGLVLLAMDVEDILEPWGARAVCPAVRFAWRWDGRKFRLDTKAMCNESRDRELPELKWAIKEQFAKVQPSARLPITLAPPELADEVLTRYYSGQARSARRFYDDCWPKGRRGKRRYWNFLMEQARHDKYWDVVAAHYSGRSRLDVPSRLVPRIIQQTGETRTGSLMNSIPAS